MRALVPPSIHEALPADLRAAAGSWDRRDPDPDDLADVELFVPPYTASPKDLRILERMPGLRLVQTLTAGVDDIMPLIPDAVTLCNAAGVHDASTAELAVGLTIASLRHIDDFARAMPDGRWLYERHESLADKRVLVVGFGSIGRAIARRLAGFECEIIGVARSERQDEGIHVHASADLRELLPTADVVILIVPLTDQTRGLVDAGFLAGMRAGALLVNVSRGPVVDTRHSSPPQLRGASARRWTSPTPSPCPLTIRSGTRLGFSSARTSAATPPPSCREPGGW